jgi:hypothetical protein
MKTLYAAAESDEITRRIAALSTASSRQWGKMNVCQAVAHCAAAMEMTVGDVAVPRVFIGRLIGGFIKPKMLGNDKPFGRNAPTARALVVSDARDLTRERERLVVLINRFVTGGPAKCTKFPHAFFGPMTPDEWGVLAYKHLDHHLRQFSA